MLCYIDQLGAEIPIEVRVLTLFKHDECRSSIFHVPFCSIVKCLPVVVWVIIFTLKLYCSWMLFLHFNLQSDISGEVVKILRKDGGKSGLDIFFL